MKRVLVIGAGGSGKTTLARDLAERTGLPLIHLDRLYWRAGWKPTPAEEWRERITSITQGSSWILDGNYGGTLDIRLEACDTVVFLDIPRAICLWRVIVRRVAHFGRARRDVAPGCPEQLTWDFLWWIWTYPRQRRGAVLGRLAAMPDEKRIVILRSASEVEAFVSGIPNAPGAPEAV